MTSDTTTEWILTTKKGSALSALLGLGGSVSPDVLAAHRDDILRVRPASDEEVAQFGAPLSPSPSNSALGEDAEACLVSLDNIARALSATGSNLAAEDIRICIKHLRAALSSSAPRTRAEVIEECAKVCDESAKTFKDNSNASVHEGACEYWEQVSHGARECASRIRSLPVSSSAPPQQEKP